MKRRRWLWCAAALAVLLGWWLWPRPADRSAIVFVSMRSGREEIHVMRGDGTGARRLTGPPASCHYMPAISPDGRKIAYVEDISGQAEIWVADIDGRNARQVTGGPGRKFAPAFCADGTALLYYTPQSHKWDIRRIYRINLDGTENHPLTSGDVDDLNPVMSPDGMTIVFGSHRDGDSELYRMDADGGNVTRLTTSPGFDGDPAFSPDGTWLAFTSGRSGASQIHRLELRSGRVTQLTRERYPAANPTVSPDGTRVAYQVGGRYDNDIHFVRVSGGDPVVLTNNWLKKNFSSRGGTDFLKFLGIHFPYCDWYPAWGPAPPEA